MNRNAFKELDAFFVNKMCLQQSLTILTLSSFSASPDLLELFKSEQPSQPENGGSRASQGIPPGKLIFTKRVY